MLNQINEGDFVRVPQLATLYQYDSDGDVKVMFKIANPLAALYLGEKEVNNRVMKELLLDGEMWYAFEEDVQKWREHANKHD